ncbi:hypothetical protein [Candidatus Borrarchaeum sp.]|uniref:hypothetical protein n=1 Tax=Candidatus Borrarchaeum sp. TaxID=2846742 RepID=UPI00257A6D81|nr:hypothetical protein [Candidatus Borrarchaeum sp.]
MLFPSNKKIVVSLDTKTAINKTLAFVLQLAKQSESMEGLIKDLENYRSMLEKQEFFEIIEQFEKL